MVLFSASLLFATVYGSWILKVALPPSAIPSHWVRSGHTGAEPFCFDLDVEQTDIYHRAPGNDPAKQKTKFCEDLEILHGEELEGWAILSCDAGRDKWNTVLGPVLDPHPRGALWMYNYKAAAEGHVEGNNSFELPALLRLDGFPKEYDFHPIGADAVPADDSASEETRKPARLFVINHSGKWSTIEIFDLYPALKASEWSARYVRTIDHPLAAHQPNALIALSHNDILVTQDHLFALRARPFSQLRQIYSFLYGEPMASALACFASLPILRGYLTKIETILGLRTGFVTRVQIEEDHDRVSVSLFDRGIAFANGIAKSPNGEMIAVASTMMPGVLLYERQHTAKGFEWTITDKIFTPNMADNIAFSRNLVALEQGERNYFGNGSQLLVTGAISGPMMVRFAKDPKNMSRASPSWVVAITPKAKDFERSEDNAPLPVQERLLGLHDRYEIKTLYQGHKPIPLSASHYGFGLVGITAAAGASMDVTVGGGTLLVAGILSDPGVMVCYGVGQ